MTKINKKDEFTLKEVTVNMCLRNDKNGHYFDIYAIQPTSPLNVPYCTAERAGLVLGKWVENTLNAMEANSAETITMQISWK